MKRSIHVCEAEERQDNERFFFAHFQVPLELFVPLYRVETTVGYVYRHVATGRLIMILTILSAETAQTTGYEVYCQPDEDARLERTLVLFIPCDTEDDVYTHDHMHHCLAQIHEKYCADGVLASQEEVQKRGNAFLALLNLVPFSREKK